MRRIRLLLAIVLLGWAGAASAEVVAHFHSKDFASTFPHAFVRLTGTDWFTGQPIDTNFGFTPERVSPGILFGSVTGVIPTVDLLYVNPWSPLPANVLMTPVVGSTRRTRKFARLGSVPTSNGLCCWPR